MTQGWEDDTGGQVQEKMATFLLAPVLEDMRYDTRLGG